MSKYIAIIDLPDDSKCDGCTLLSEDCCGETGHWFRGWNYDRPTDCPLIPVDRVIERIREKSLNPSTLVGKYLPPHIAYSDIFDILQDELGVTE